MGADRRQWVWGAVIAAVFVGAAAIALVVSSPDDDLYVSPATGAFETLNVKVPRFSCEEGALLGGGRIQALEGVTAASSAEDVGAAAAAVLTESGLEQFSDLELLSSTGRQRVYVVNGSGGRVDAAVVVESGPSEMLDPRGDPGEGWSLKAIGFCSG